MTIYIALLRGINVGGKNMIKMADLKRILETSSLSQVETYIQSGNILFESDEDEETLREKIQKEIEKVYGFSVVVVLRTAFELSKIIEECPFTKDEIIQAEMANTEGESLYVSLLTQAPQQEKKDNLNTYRNENDEFQMINREIYILLRHSIRNSKLANNLSKLDVAATTRNWKTLNKLYDLVKARQTN